ncbi:MAG: type I-F CRISPR-associated protein Csy2 [Desulforhopalus sp.]|nr:type I-F CRISPR-associated protein Csy2 [Desulforhopalus sp.]
MKKLMLINRLTVLNANALSSPYTIGVPAMTAVCGFMHALQRHLNARKVEGRFCSVGIVYHECQLQTHKGAGDYNASIIGTGNPLVPKTKKGHSGNAERPSFIEEARCHLTLSLLMEYEGFDSQELADHVPEIIASKMKFAGGDIIAPLPVITCTSVEKEDENIVLLRSMMPGFCLVERRELMVEAMTNGMDGIDALLEFLKVTSQSEEDENGRIEWTRTRREKGWLVPVAVGFQGLTPPGEAVNQRDPETPHRFAEAVVTLGEFIMPYRISNLDNMLWHYRDSIEDNLYICEQNTPITRERKGDNHGQN